MFSVLRVSRTACPPWKYVIHQINFKIQILKAKMDDDYSRAQTVSSSINQVRKDAMVFFVHKACVIVTLDVYFFCLMGAPNKWKDLRATEFIIFREEQSQQAAW